MELLQGESLSARLIRRNHLDVEQTASILTQMAFALDEVHQHRIVHRDIKPGNVFLCQGEQGGDFVKLLDFGISKLLDNSSNLTLMDARLGTPYFMAPEQANPRDVDHRADIYAAGVMIFVMLTGEPPFWGDKGGGDTFVRLQRQQMSEPPASLCSLRPELPEEMEALVNRALAADAKRRQATAGELAEDFARVAEQYLEHREPGGEETTLQAAGDPPRDEGQAEQSQDTVMEEVVSISSMDELVCDTRQDSSCELEPTVMAQHIRDTHHSSPTEPRTVIGRDAQEETLRWQSGPSDRVSDVDETHLLESPDDTPARTRKIERHAPAPTAGESASARVAAWARAEETEKQGGDRKRRLIIAACSTVTVVLCLVLVALLIHDASRGRGALFGAGSAGEPAKVVPPETAGEVARSPSTGSAGELPANESARRVGPEAAKEGNDRAESNPSRSETVEPSRNPVRGPRSRATGRGRLEVFTLHADRTLWAEVLIDGKRVGRSPLMLRRVTAGPHRVKVRRSGFRTITKKVTVRPGRRIKLVIDLEKSK